MGLLRPPPSPRPPRRGPSGPSAVEVVEGVNPPRPSEPELGMRNFFRFLHTREMGSARNDFKSESSLSANFFRQSG